MQSVHPRSIAALALTTALAASASGCVRGTVMAKLDSDLAPAQRAANSFLHCVEMGSSRCVKVEDTVGGWDAFYILGWLGGGSPMSILEALPNELSLHADPRFVQRRFVTEVERYAVPIRGAECDAGDLQPIDPLIDQVAQVANERMVRLGLWQGDMSGVMQGLADEAHETLGGGFLVRLDCSHDPHQLWVATREVDGRHVVVGLTTLLPRFLGGAPPSREDVADRLVSHSLGLATSQAPVVAGDVDPWLPFPIEEF